MLKQNIKMLMVQSSIHKPVNTDNCKDADFKSVLNFKLIL